MSADRWIPVAEMKPEGRFWFASNGHVAQGECCAFFGKKDEDGWPYMRLPGGHRLYPNNITHWMPLYVPHPPTEREL